MKIGVIDYGLGNVASVRNMLRRSGLSAEVVQDPREISGMDKIILPGVGHFGRGMQMLSDGGWTEPLIEHARVRKKPVLGICLGMQLLGSHSEEGDCQGLGLLPIRTVKFRADEMAPGLKIPHMGWAHVKFAAASALTEGLDKDSRFYFVHSLHVEISDPQVAPLLWCHHGYDFVAACQVGNIMGVQFHPEKSHAFGKNLLLNFAKL